MSGNRIFAVGLWALLEIASPAGAATIDADSELLAASATLQQLLPAARTFTVTTAGPVEVIAADLGTPAALTGLKVLVTRGGTRVAKLDAAGTVQFNATAGAYKVQVVGSVAGTTPGSFNINVRNAGATTSLLTFSDDITPPPAVPADAATSGLDDTFTITQAGSYTITITDRNLPVALSSIDLVVLQQGGPLVTTNAGPCSPTCTKGPFSLAAGNYDIGGFVTASGADKAGLYSVAVTGGPAVTTVYGKTIPVGLLPSGQPVTLATGSMNLTTSDFANPVALAALQARVVQGANLVGTLNAAGSVGLTGNTTGAGTLFVFARAGGTGGTGAYGVKLAQGATTVFEDARPLPEGYSAVNNVGGYRFQTTISTGGTYTLQLRDYAFPVIFTSLRALIVQGGTQVGAVSGVGSSQISLAAGTATLLIFGAPPTATSNSLFGLSLTPLPGTVPVLEQAQGVGGLFRTRNVTIAAAGSYDLSLSDLQVPEGFGELALALTQGPTLKGQMFGGGKLTFDVPSAGVYSMNILARLGTGSNYGSYGVELVTTPPVPVVTLTATPASVASGQTTSLQWSASDATSCTASGGWSGAKSASGGTETTSAVTAPTTYTLTCTGPGGSVNKSVSVSISAPSGGGGGGTIDAALLGLALLMLLVRAVPSLQHRREKPST